MKTFMLILILLFDIGDSDAASSYQEESFDCLTKTIYFESRSEDVPGQFAVASVVLNRVQSSLYPNTVCKVVYQPYQFSWTLIQNPSVNDLAAWETARQVAAISLQKGFVSNVGTALDYHSIDVNPRWAKSYKVTLRYGHHIFYERT
jgi:spore germination cell wall hydrolase CwlJ-like protein